MTREEIKKARVSGFTNPFSKMNASTKWGISAVVLAAFLSAFGLRQTYKHYLGDYPGALRKKLGFIEDQFKDMALIYGVGPKLIVHGNEQGLYANGWTKPYLGTDAKKMKGKDVGDFFPTKRDSLEMIAGKVYSLPNSVKVTPDSILYMTEVNLQNGDVASLEMITAEGEHPINVRLSVNEALTEARTRSDSLKQAAFAIDSTYWAVRDSTSIARGIEPTTLVYVDKGHLSQGRVVVRQIDLDPDTMRMIAKSVIDDYDDNARIIDLQMKKVLSPAQWKLVQEHYGEPGNTMALAYRNWIVPGYNSEVYTRDEEGNKPYPSQQRKPFLVGAEKNFGGATQNPQLAYANPVNGNTHYNRMPNHRKTVKSTQNTGKR
ncbi:MAG: hypothetical protein U9O94_03640 [Nanoarchaeota archaeon]|nr:hypothetical protein [Nanoarchaeota archaeon]